MDLDKVFGALADPTRRQILEELAERDGQSLYELCVRLIMLRKINMTRQAISKHLAILEDVGLVTTEWSGRQKLHSLNREPIEKMSAGWLQTLLAPGKPRPGAS